MRRVPPRSTVRACVALALGVLVAGAVATPEPIADGGVRAWVAHWTLPHCLTPNAGQALNELREAGRIAAALPAGWTLTGGEIESDMPPNPLPVIVFPVMRTSTLPSRPLMSPDSSEISKKRPS